MTQLQLFIRRKKDTVATYDPSEILNLHGFEEGSLVLRNGGTYVRKEEFDRVLESIIGEIPRYIKE